MKPDPSDTPTPEITDLIIRYGEQRLEPGELTVLEGHLREDEAARELFADRLRFDAEIQEVLNPPPRLEWSETKNLVMTDGKNWEIQRHQSLRSGTQHGAGGEKTTSRRLLALLILLGVFVGALVTLLIWPDPKPETVIPKLTLRNPDFEQTDLTFATSGKNSVIIGWQDYFTTSYANIAEISRVSDGRIFAKSGRNVAMLHNYAFLTQQLRHADGSAMLVEPNMRIRIRGWVYVMDGPAPHSLRVALRFVATGKPGMIQYELAHDEVHFEPNTWQHFTIEMTLPDDLEVPPSDVDPGMDRPPAVNLESRKLALSLDSRCAAGTLLLDDLEIEEVKR